MTTSRPYRKGTSLDQVETEIERETGHQFDPQIGEKLLSPAPWATLVEA
jgi:HD-GYP domain-containing protein (c-di-GMP phosphodiesterase class II)